MADKTIRAKLVLDDNQFKKGLKGAQQQTSTFVSSLKKIGGAIAGVFAVGSLINFGKEAYKLSATLQGVKKGFDHIADPRLLDELRQATRGAVDDLTLMKTAVKASNFQIPLESLSKLLAFASARAIQTGESIDYLVESIILGIGRKSPLILDNLGISAVRLRQELKGAGVEMTTVGDVAAAVGKIAEEEMSKMGETADTTRTMIEKLGVSWKSFMASVGNIATSRDGGIVGWLKENVDYWTWGLNNIEKKGGGFIEWWKWFWSSYEDEYLASKQFIKEIDDNLPKEGAGRQMNWESATDEEIAAAKKLAEEKAKESSAYGAINKQIKDLTEQVNLFLPTQEQEIGLAHQKIELLKLQLSYYDALGTSLTKLSQLDTGAVYGSFGTYTPKNLQPRNETSTMPANIYDPAMKEAEKFVDANGIVIDSNKEAEDSVYGVAMAYADLGVAMGNAASSMLSSTDSIVSMIINMVAQLLPLIISYAVLGATESAAGTGPGAAIALPIFIAEMLAIVLGTLASFAFAEGGIVPGSSYSGDNVIGRLNSGEMVLNGAQQRNLMDIINGGSNSTNSMVMSIYGADLYSSNKFEVKRRAGMR